MLQKLRKLRKASPGELSGRLRDLVRRQADRRAFHRAGNPPIVPETTTGLLSGAARVLGAAGEAAIKHLSYLDPAVHELLTVRAAAGSRAVMDGAWTLLGEPMRLGGDVDWHRDPLTGQRFPRVFYADVPLQQNVDVGVDVKYIWELGRQQFVVELARGWLFTKEERYARSARRLMLSWIEHNPLYEGVHWTSGLEVAVRAVSWIWTLATLAEWNGWRDEELERIAASLVEHATYLEHHFSFYSSPYNHLIGEATGLYLISQVLKSLPEAARWRSKARHVLDEHGPRQFYSDGFCVEQAMGYHYFTLGFLAMAIVAARNEGEPLTQVEPAAHRAFRTGILFQQPDGRWPAIGDVDSARSIPVHHEDFWDFSSLCSLGAVLFNDPQLKRPGMQPGEELYWLLGCDGINRWHKLETTSADGFTHLPESGYVVARQGVDWLCFDAGPIAHGLHADATPSTAHGHLDTLQVLYCHGGQPVLIDPGMPQYFGDREWVRHFRSAAAHNTIEITGAPFARDVGRLTWAQATVPTDLHADAVDGVWLVYGRWERGREVVIERSILAWPGKGLWIADRVHTVVPREVTWHWQWPESTVSQRDSLGGTSWRISIDSTPVTVSTEGQPIECDILRADAASPMGWRSEGYGQTGAATAVRIRQPEVADSLLLTGFAGSGCEVEVSFAGRRIGHGRRRGPNGGDGREFTQLNGRVTWRIGTGCGGREHRALPFDGAESCESLAPSGGSMA